MIGWTLCSGIGAPEMAAPGVDWRLAAEIEPFPRAVLREQFGYVPHEYHSQGEPILWGDMTTLELGTVQGRGVPLPDLLVAGTPCQSFSVAGLRKGLADDRGNLTLKFVEICHAIVDARPDGRLAVLWENVPGVLSDTGNAFGAFLGGLVGGVAPLVPAEPPRKGGSKACWRWNKPRRWRHRGRRKHRKGFWSPVWPGEGMVQGPRARAAWAVLDAQWFGVAQRRRRVFVVVDFGGACDPAQVLLEPDRLRGDTPPRRETGQGSAGTLSARTEGGGGLGTDFELAGGQTALPEVAWALQERDAKGADSDTKEGHLIPVTHALRGEGFDASEAGTGRGTPIVPIAFHPTQDPISSSDGSVHALGTGSTRGQCSAAVAFDLRGRDDGAQIESVGETVSLRAADGGSSRSYVAQGIPFDLNQITSKTNRSQPDPAVHHTLPATACPPHLATPWAVRRLTPIECARLQGFPDDHCAITYRGKPAADGPQYKAYGNSMAVPVVRWILERMI
jgi:DNA (cytosine-5)-methyltransferase 1